MFCSECGTKNKKDAMFCSECGNKLSKEVKETKTTKKEDTSKKEVVVKEKKPLGKKQKICLVVVLCLAVLLGVGYKVASDKTNPKHIADEYIKAVINNDTNKLYGYLDLTGDKTFVSKKIFKEVMKDEKKTNVENYKITDVEKKDLTAKVKFSYTTKDSSNESTGTINLTKEKGKKYFFFDNWKVSNISTSSVILEKYTIKVLKGSSLTYAGVKVDSKYLDKEQSTSEYDVYVLPQVFKSKTVISAKLSNGLEVENEVTPSTYYDTITLKFDKNSISKDMEKELLKTSKSALTSIYKSAINKTEVKEAVKEFEHKGIDLTDLETTYSEFLDSLTRSTNKLTSIKFNDLEIYSLDVDDKGNFNVEVKANYDYTVEYLTSYDNQTKTTNKTTYGYMKLVLKYDNSKFYLKDLDNLKTYFSRY